MTLCVEFVCDLCGQTVYGIPFGRADECLCHTCWFAETEEQEWVRRVGSGEWPMDTCWFAETEEQEWVRRVGSGEWPMDEYPHTVTGGAP